MGENRVKKAILAGAIGVVAVVGVGASAASAGEITGNGRWIAGSEDAPLHGKSICAYSGQNDEYQLGDESAARTQSWGQDVRSAVAAGEDPPGGVPGSACNPSGG